MKHFFLMFAVVLLAATVAPRAQADGAYVDYSITGTYAANTLNDGLCAPNQTFSIDFTVPAQPGDLNASYMAGDDFYVYPLPITFSLGGGAPQTGDALVGFYESTSAWQAGGFFINYCPDDASCVTGTNYQWAFSGPQEYTGPESDPTIVPASFTFANQPFTVFQDSYTEYDSTICGTVSASVVATPEPSVLVLLLAGMGVLALLLHQPQLGMRRFLLR